MAKTITLRVDEETYELIKAAAAGEKRSIANYIEYATVAYLTEDNYVSDEEMEGILADDELIARIRSGESEITKGKYRVVE